MFEVLIVTMYKNANFMISFAALQDYEPLAKQLKQIQIL